MAQIQRSARFSYVVILFTLLLLKGCGSTPASDEREQGPIANSQSTKTMGKEKRTNTELDVAQSLANESSPKLDFKDYKLDENDDGSFPQRLALMPFSSKDEVSEDIMLMLRQSVFSHLSSTNYIFVRPQEVDQRIAMLDQQKEFTPADAATLASILDTDAILLGKVLSSDVTYVGVAAQIYFEVEMSLVSKSGRVLWSEIFSERSLEGGFSADPFSMLYSLAVTAMHVGQENLFAVSDKIGRQVAKAIVQPKGAFAVDKLVIDSVIHDAANKTLKYGDILKVGVKAPANMSVSVSIEGIAELFSAKQSDPGSYFVDIPINSKWNGDKLLLTAFVLDKTGKRARKISHLGLLNIDNTAPLAVTGIDANLAADKLTLKWQEAEEELQYSVYEIIDNERVLLVQTNETQVSFSKEHRPFQTYQYAVIATDKAQNSSDETSINERFMPSNVLKQATVISRSKLPLTIEKDSRLTKLYSPYLVDNTTLVSSGAILFIEPGVVLEFTQTGILAIEGSLKTYGLEPVVFRAMSNKQQDQSFIRINSSRHIELDGFVIENAGIGLEVIKGKPNVQNCEINNSNYTALSISGMANVEVENCLINGSNTSAVVVADNARLKIENATFTNNFPFHIQNSSTYQVDARNNKWQPEADAITILGNVKY